MASNEASAQKQELKTLERGLKIHLDCVREDRIRKELYRNEMKAQEKWYKKWEFLKNREKSRNNEKMEAYFESDTHGKREKLLKEKGSREMHDFKVQKVPTLSSGMIGWMAAAAENNLNEIGGTIYVSKKQTMNLPKNPEEPDLNYQKFIILG